MSSSRKVATTAQRSPTIKQLSKTELFRQVSRSMIRQLLKQKAVRFITLQPEETLPLTDGDEEYIYVIVSGYLEVRLRSDLIKKGDDFLLAFRGPDQIVGEMRAITREPGVAFIGASEPCDLIQISSEALQSIAEEDWHVYRNIASLLVKKTRQERRRIEVSLMQEGKPQVAQALLNFLEERGADTESDNIQIIHGMVRQRDIADYIGCDRSTVAKPLGGLKTNRIIDYPNKGYHVPHPFKIIDRNRLEKAAREKKKR
jgi:CRP-like cAMP-binding protein